jgi:hypothetical protein
VDRYLQHVADYPSELYRHAKGFGLKVMSRILKKPYFFLFSIAATVLLIPFGIYSLNRGQATCHYRAIEAGLTQSTNQDPSISHGTGKIAIYQPNPHYFQDLDGKPIFLVGPYAFWGSLDLLKGKSNYMRLGTDGMDLPLHWRRSNPWPRVPASGKTSTGIEGKFDLTKFEETYFAELRSFIADALAHGIYVHVSFFNEIFVKHKPKCCGFGRHPFGNGNHINENLIGNVDRNKDLSGKGANEFYDAQALWGKTRDAQRLAVADLQRRYVEKVLAETRDFPNVFYEIGNEISASHDWIAYWVRFIRARASNPISVDDTHDNKFNPLTNENYPVDAATYHTGDVVGDTIQRSMPSHAYQHNKILGNDTDGVGRTINRHADQNRQGAWLTLLGGGGIWGDYFDGWALEDFPDEVAYFGYLFHFLRSSQLKYWEMAPCNKLTNKGRVLAKPGAEYLIYTTTAGTVTVDLGAASGTLAYEWYNPRTGEFMPASHVLGGSRRAFTTPDARDWLLHISNTPLEARPSTPRTLASETVLFRDKFGNGDSEAWKPDSGTWQVCQPPGFSKVYCNTTTQGSLSLAGNSTWSDYAVQGQVFLGDENGGISLLGRVQNASQYYQLELKKDPATGMKKWWIFKNDRGVWTHIASGNYPFVANAFYFLRLDMRGSLLTAFVALESGSGHSFRLLGSGTDTSFATGKIGVRSWGSTARFGEIRVTSRPGAS